MAKGFENDTSFGFLKYSWQWTQNLDILFPERLSYHVCFMVYCSIMLKKALLSMKLRFGG